MTIVDSTVWIDVARGVRTPQTLWYQQHSQTERFGLTDLILMEVLQGTSDETEFVRTETLLSKFRVFDSGGAPLAIAAARNYRLLRTRGITVRKSIDCLIATFCMSNGYALLQNDRDFDHFERVLGLKVIHPQTQPVRELSLDASTWTSWSDGWDDLARLLQFPSWHGRNANALLDSIVPGQMNGIEIPYAVIIRNTSGVNSDIKQFLAMLKDVFAAAANERKAHVSLKLW